MKKYISLILAAAMLLSLFTFVSCDEQTVNDVLDAALAVVEALPDAETDGHSAEDDLSDAGLDDSPELTDDPGDSGEPELEEDEAPESEEIPETEPEEAPAADEKPVTEEVSAAIDENGSYDDRESVALYIHTYGKLPPNYITKAEAEDLGWEGGSVEKYAPGKCIGGSRFGNYEGLLPKKSGRQYYECDIGTLGKNSRGAERIVYSNDGLVYYTGDHYESFELLYGEE